MEIGEPKPPGTLWATPGLLRDTFTFTFLQLLVAIFMWKISMSFVVYD